MANFKCNNPYPVNWNGVTAAREPDRSKPYPPRNTFVTHPYITGILDIRWDNPLEVIENNNWKVIGVNIYRSEDSECGPYEKINTSPIETLYYRDQTIHRLIADEDVTTRIHRGSQALSEWMFCTVKKPIVKESSQNILADTPNDVSVKIDNGDGQGALVVPVASVNGRTGEIFLITKPIYNPQTKKIEEPRLPGENGKIFCSYWYNTNFIRSDLYPRFFYKIATVALDSCGNTIETSLNDIAPSNVYQIEKPDYIWKAIIAKNRYLLEKLGERAKLFIRKEVGERCPNYSDTHQQAHYACKLCYGTGFLGGYFGPSDVLIASPEAEKHIDLTDAGLKLNFVFESWTGPSPLLRTRDFIVRQNGERLVIGSVTPQGAKGSVFQQHFSLNYRDSKDIIYDVPIFGGQRSVPVVDDTRNINHPITDASPQIPEHKSERAETDKGRTIDYENVVW